MINMIKDRTQYFLSIICTSYQPIEFNLHQIMFRIAKGIFKHSLNLRYYFCELKDTVTTWKSMNLATLRQNISKESNYVATHNQEIGQHIIQSIKEQKWSYLIKLLLTININSLGSWFLIRKISKTINSYCNQLTVQSMHQQELKKLFSTLQLLGFQPKRHKAESQYSSNTEYDDSTQFVNSIQRLVKKSLIENNEDFLFLLLRKFLHTNSDLFIENRQFLQNKVLDRLNQLIQNRSFKDIIMRGCVSSYWTDDFRSKIKAKNIPANYLNAFHFEDLSIPTKIQVSLDNNNVKTENQILNILSGFGYIVQKNVFVNNYEVDFIISNRLIVQFNGLRHYAINSPTLIPSAKDQWKNRILRKRNFVVCSISFIQWSALRSFEEKREFIVRKIENDWLSNFKGATQ